MGCRCGICAGAEGGNNNRKVRMNKILDCDTEVELLIDIPDIKENKTIYWYWYQIGYNLEIDLDDYLCLTLVETEGERDAVIFMILFWISWKWDIKNLNYKLINNKLYIYQNDEEK